MSTSSSLPPDEQEIEKNDPKSIKLRKPFAIVENINDY